MPPSTLTADDPAVILGKCRAVLARHAPLLVTAYLQQVTQQLFTALRNAAKPGDQRRIEELHRLFDQRRKGIAQDIEKQLITDFDQLTNASQRKSSPVLSATHHGLSLMESKDLHESMALAESVRVIESALKLTLYELRERLGAVFGRRMDDENNPLVPASVCLLFRENVIHHVPAARGRPRYLADALSGAFITRLGSFYDELNHTLKACGVLPVVKLNIVRN